ncbi:hypothetical protein KRX57_02940 [Weeksellaceae bacterium TAE3-ERU29]|nr:hypothetical protein [Weeksellaceae bacterium TAE3-ERU29]
MKFIDIKKYTFIILSALFVLSACNETAEDLPDEDYEKLFGGEKIKPPYLGYETMPKLPCEPEVSKKEYIYPGKEIEDKRDYTVTVKFYFKEVKRIQDGSPASSKVDLRFVGENKELEILKTYKSFYIENDKIDFENGKQYTKTFKVKSGFPLYLGISGAGYDNFNMVASIKAKSDDGLIETPELKYEVKTNVDGLSDTFSYCEKIILP